MVRVLSRGLPKLFLFSKSRFVGCFGLSCDISFMCSRAFAAASGFFPDKSAGYARLKGRLWAVANARSERCRRPRGTRASW